MLRRHLFDFLRTTYTSRPFITVPKCFFAKIGRNDPYRDKLKDDQEEVITLKDIQIPRDKIETNFSRSSGPGGQNVNKLNTKAEIRFNISTCSWLEDDVKKRLRLLHKNAINKDDELIVTSQVGRTQTHNLDDAFEKMRMMVYQASIPEKEKKNVIPAETKMEETRRINHKKKRSDVKSTRSGKSDW